MKPGNPLLISVRLLDQLRERIRYLHYSLKTEKAYVYWVRCYVRWNGLLHPPNMGNKEAEAILSMLSNERKVSAFTHNRALGALPILYREILGQNLPWLSDIQTVFLSGLFNNNILEARLASLDFRQFPTLKPYWLPEV